MHTDELYPVYFLDKEEKDKLSEEDLKNYKRIWSEWDQLQDYLAATYTDKN